MGKRKGYRQRFMIILPLVVGIFSAVHARDMLAQYMDMIKTGPTTYYTPEAAQYYGQSSGDRNALEKSFEAMEELSDMGMKSSPAIPVIVEKFPAAVHVSTISGKRYTGGEPFDDWISTFLIAGENSIMLSPPFLDEQAMSFCESYLDITHTTNFIEKNETAGGKITSSLVDIHIIYRINIGACMLSRITGVNAGKSVDDWRNWLSANSQMIPNFENAPKDFAPHVHGHPDFKDFVPGGKYRLLMVSKQDLNGTVHSVSDTAIVFDTADENRRFLLRRKQIFRSRLLELPQEKQEKEEASESKPQQKSEKPKETAAKAKTPSSSDSPQTTGRKFAFEDLNLLRDGTNIEVKLNNGSLLIGTMHSFDGKILTLELIGLRVPLRGSVVESIVVP